MTDTHPPIGFEPTQFLDPFSSETWASTYQDKTDVDVDSTFWRVAKAIAKAEKTPELQDHWAIQYFKLLHDFHGVTGGRIMANAGHRFKGTTLMNCYVAPNQKEDTDSLRGIIENVYNQTATLKSEGGWGENFSYIRPRGTHIYGIGVDTPGAVRYMELFNESSAIITEGSGKAPSIPGGKQKIRKGAMMGVLDVWHPDIIEFIRAKQTQGRLDKFNISVNFTDEFMERLIAIFRAKADGDEAKAEALDTWDLIFPDTQHPDYEAVWDGDIAAWQGGDRPVNVINNTKVTTIWDMVMKSTYNRNDPGVLFLDRANYYYPAYYANRIKATNPCGEQTLPPSGVCNLGSINLTRFIRVNGTVYFDFEAFEEYVAIMVRFLDDVNDITEAPLPEYAEFIKNYRRIGVGVMGWGSMLMMMKIRFGSKAAAELRENIMARMARKAYETSIDLAEEKGMFPKCVPELHAQGAFVQSLGLSRDYIQKMVRVGIRNSSILSMQPTGNTGIFANVVSGGIEPIFMPYYTRTVIVNSVPDEILSLTPSYWEGNYEETDLFKWTMEGEDKILRGEHDGIVYKIDTNRGLTKEVECIDYGVRWLMDRGEWDENAEWNVCVEDLTPEEHLDDLKGFARWVDSAISKTINVPNDISYGEFQHVYLDAYQSGYIKGVTTYRLGTMMSVLSKKEDNSTDEEVILDDVKLPDSCPAEIKTLRAAGKKWYLTITKLPDTERPFALFAHTNNREPTAVADSAIEHLIDLARAKKIPEDHIETAIKKMSGDTNVTKVCRSISLLLRHGVLIKNIVLALDKDEACFVGTFTFAIKKYLSGYIKDGEMVEGASCEDCGGDVTYREGCFVCVSCGSSKCG